MSCAPKGKRQVKDWQCRWQKRHLKQEHPKYRMESDRDGAYIVGRERKEDTHRRHVWVKDCGRSPRQALRRIKRRNACWSHRRRETSACLALYPCNDD